MSVRKAKKQIKKSLIKECALAAFLFGREIAYAQGSWVFGFVRFIKKILKSSVKGKLKENIKKLIRAEFAGFRREMMQKTVFIPQ